MLEERWSQIGALNTFALRSVIAEIEPFTFKDTRFPIGEFTGNLFSVIRALQSNPPNLFKSYSYRLKFGFDFPQTGTCQGLLLPTFDLDLRNLYDSMAQVITCVETQMGTETDIHHLPLLWIILRELRKWQCMASDGDIDFWRLREDVRFRVDKSAHRSVKQLTSYKK